MFKWSYSAPLHPQFGLIQLFPQERKFLLAGFSDMKKEMKKREFLKHMNTHIFLYIILIFMMVPTKWWWPDIETSFGECLYCLWCIILHLQLFCNIYDSAESHNSITPLLVMIT